MVTPAVIAGNADVGVMVIAPVPTPKSIVLPPALAFDSWIAARSVQTPPLVAQMPLPGLESAPSPALLTTMMPPGTARAAGRPRVAPPAAGTSVRHAADASAK